MNCCWTGYPCNCKDFPYKVDGLIPRECEKRITFDMIPLRAVRPALKEVYRIYHKALQDETYDAEDKKWSILLQNAINIS